MAPEDHIMLTLLGITRVPVNLPDPVLVNPLKHQQVLHLLSGDDQVLLWGVKRAGSHSWSWRFSLYKKTYCKENFQRKELLTLCLHLISAVVML